MKERRFITLDGRMKKCREVCTRFLRRSKDYGSDARKSSERGVDLRRGGPGALSGIFPSLEFLTVRDAVTTTTAKQSGEGSRPNSGLPTNEEVQAENVKLGPGPGLSPFWLHSSPTV